MSYEVFARKWRPQVFEDVIGQEHITQTLINAIKADRLAAGKGVIIADSIPQALDALSSLMEAKTLGAAGDRVIIEEHLSGKEMSAFAFTDARTVVPMVPACDYKRIYDGDQGPNTGGMGSYSPPPFFNPALDKAVKETIMEPAVCLRKKDLTGASFTAV